MCAGEGPVLGSCVRERWLKWAVGPWDSLLALTLVLSCACLDSSSSGERYQVLGFTSGDLAPFLHGLSWGHGWEWLLSSRLGCVSCPAELRAFG